MKTTPLHASLLTLALLGSAPARLRGNAGAFREFGEEVHACGGQRLAAVCVAGRKLRDATLLFFTAEARKAQRFKKPIPPPPLRPLRLYGKLRPSLHHGARHFLRVTARRARGNSAGLMKSLFLSLITTTALALVAVPAARAADEKAVKEVAVLKTSAGEMVVEFWPETAPNTVANFIKLAKKGFYDGTAFHRIIKGFMIQGGDPQSKDASKEERWGTGGSGEQIKAEFSERKHDFGVISMARSASPDSASSQFFICLEGAQALNGKYTCFGKLIKGEDVLKKLGDTPVTASASGEPSKPEKRVALESVKIVPADSVK